MDVKEFCLNENVEQIDFLNAVLFNLRNVA